MSLYKVDESVVADSLHFGINTADATGVKVGLQGIDRTGFLQCGNGVTEPVAVLGLRKRRSQ